MPSLEGACEEVGINPRGFMHDRQARNGAKQTLFAVLATAASMGIDIDALSYQAASDLGKEESGWIDQLS